MSVELKNIRQAEQAIRLSRILGVELALTGLLLAIIGHDSAYTSPVVIGLAIALVITVFLFTFLVQKAE